MGGLSSKSESVDSKFTLKFGKGKTEIAQFKDAVLQIVVDSNLHLPSMFTIELYDELKDSTAYKWIDSSQFALGTDVEISVEAAKVPNGQKHADLDAMRVRVRPTPH